MASLTIMGLDPSMNNFGMVVGELELNTGELSNICTYLSSPDKPKDKKSVRQNSKDLLHCQQQYHNLHGFINQYMPEIICVEIPVGSQSARAMASYGMCIGILSSIGTPLIQVTPTEVKVAATKSKTATKQDMIDWATKTYPEASWLTRNLKGVQTYTQANEHLADALAAIYAGVKTDDFKLLTAMRK